MSGLNFSTVAAGALWLALAGCGGSDGGAVQDLGSDDTSNITTSDNASDVESTSATSEVVDTTERSLVTASESGTGDAEETLSLTFGVDEVIRFDTGGTSATMASAVIRGERHRYTLEAAAGQTMIVGIVSLEDNAVFDIYGPDDVLLAAEGTAASIVLPVDGDYVIIVGGTRGNASYDLTVEIPAG